MHFNILRQLSLKTRLTLFTLTIFLLSMWSLAYYASQMLHEDMERLVGEQQSATVSLLAQEVNHELESRLQALTVVAGGIDADLLTSPRALQKYLDERTLLHPLFNAGVHIVGADGVALADVSILVNRVGTDYSDNEDLRAALSMGKAGVGRPLIGPLLKQALFPIIVPILNPQGQALGAIVGNTSLGASNFLDQVTENRYGRSGGYLLVAPQHRLIVTATNKGRIMATLPPTGVNPGMDRFAQGFEGSDIFVDPSGVEVLAAVKSVPVAGWYIAATMPSSEAFAPIHTMQQRMLVIAIALTLLAGGLTWWMLQRQLAPLQATAKTLSALPEQDGDIAPLAVGRQDEIGQLIVSFNRLLADLGQRKALLRQILDTSSVAIFVVDNLGRITQANQCMAEMFACPLETLVGSDYVSLVHPSERAAGRQKMLALLASTLPSVNLDRMYCRADQTEFWGHLNGKRFFDADGTEHGLIGVIADISERKRAEEKLQLAANVFTHAREGILITTADGTIIDVNDSFSRITGYSRDEALGRNPRMLSSGRQSKAYYAAMWQVLIESGQWDGEIWNKRKSGEIYAQMQTISTVRNADGKSHNYVALFSDITTLKAQQQQLELMAHFDVLTGLPNRVLLADRMQQAMVQVQRRGQRLAVAYLDLDGFKTVNDSHGHEVGDQLLIGVASRMKQALREGDTLARLGGDEFVAVLLDLPDAAACVPVLTRLLTAAGQPVLLGELKLLVSASLGVTFYPQTHDMDADQLLRQADQAMYQAKLAGKNRFHIFDAEQDSSIRGHHENLERVQQALKEHEFVLHYQPKVNMRSGAVIGVEALIRWQHPQNGLLPPALFLPLIENHPLAIEVGEWALQSALHQMSLWQADGLDLAVSVNVGARQLQQPGFGQRLAEILALYPDVRPTQLELEVLETSALEDLPRVSQVMAACQQLGVSFALDDFGTGYSSLTYLKHLRVSLLKVDRSFVHNMLDDPDDLAILEGVIGLASAFRCRVIAEGVESVEHGVMLLQLGCELAQGYTIARPMPAVELAAWLAAWRPDPAWAVVQTVSRLNLPLLRAMVEYRAWTAAVEAFLRGERSEPPPLDPQQCRFGIWLSGEGPLHYGSQSAFKALQPLCQQGYALATQLIDLQASQGAAAALARLGDLHECRDAMLHRLQSLARGSLSA